jgi:hypothetical protein
MSDQDRELASLPARDRLGAMPALAGAAAGLLYSSVALALLCLAPIQMAYGRRGRRGGLAAAGVAAAVVAAAMVARVMAAGSLSPVSAAVACLPPIVLIAALVLVNARFWERLPATYRVLAVAAACALGALPFLAGLAKDREFAAFLESRLDAVLSPMRAQIGDQNGYEASALAAALDAKSIAETAMRTLSSIYAAILAFTLGFDWWIGNRMAGPGSPGREAAPSLSDYRVPGAILWAFLAAWTLVLAAMALDAPDAAKATAWNCAVVLSLPYAAQGVGIASCLLNKWNAPRLMKAAVAATAVLALAYPTSSVVVGIGLPLLGVTEVWIPYRNLKGVGA